MVLAILNLNVVPMPTTKFWLNLTYHLGADEVWPSWISEQNNFSNFESLCTSDASNQVWAQSALQFGRRYCFEEFQDGRHGGHLRCWNGTNFAGLILHVSPMPPTKFQFNLTYRSEADVT